MRLAYLTIAAVAVSLVVGAGVVRASAVSIEQSGQQFSEKAVALKSGDNILFANHDDVTHNINVINDDDDATDLGLQKPGETLNYKFDKTGKFKVRCSIHPSMKMTVTVK